MSSGSLGLMRKKGHRFLVEHFGYYVSVFHIRQRTLQGSPARVGRASRGSWKTRKVPSSWGIRPREPVFWLPSLNCEKTPTVTVLGKKHKKKSKGNTVPVSPVSGTESVVDVDIAQLGQAGLELLHLLGFGFQLDLSILVDSLALLLQMETEIFQENDRARDGIRAGLLHFRPDAVVQKNNFPVKPKNQSQWSDHSIDWLIGRTGTMVKTPRLIGWLKNLFLQGRISGLTDWLIDWLTVKFLPLECLHVFLFIYFFWVLSFNFQRPVVKNYLSLTSSTRSSVHQQPVSGRIYRPSARPAGRDGSSKWPLWRPSPAHTGSFPKAPTMLLKNRRE